MAICEPLLQAPGLDQAFLSLTWMQQNQTRATSVVKDLFKQMKATKNNGQENCV